MNRTILVILALLCALPVLAGPRLGAHEERDIIGKVTRIIAPDEIVVTGVFRGSEAPYRIRLAGVQAPPKNTRAYQMALSGVRNTLLGKTVRALLLSDQEAGGTPRARVRLLGRKEGRTNVIRKLVADGLLLADQQHSGRQIQYLERRARKYGAGIWALQEPGRSMN